MYSNIDDVKKELKELCLEYVTILEKLKDEKMITEETFEKCSSQKKIFLEEQQRMVIVLLLCSLKDSTKNDSNTIIYCNFQL